MLLFVPNEALAKEDITTKAKQGVFDARALQGHRVNLSGEWEFYWKQLLTPNDFSVKTMSETYANIPHQWGDMKLEGKSLSEFGYATYRLTLLVPNEEIGQYQAISLPNIASSYRIWIDGVLSESVGKVGKTEEASQPANSSKVISFTPKSSKVEIVIQVSNFSQRKGGLWSNIIFGKQTDIVKEKNNYYVISGLLIGSLVIISIYHFVMYVYRRKEKSVLFFSLTCLGIALRTLVLEGNISSTLFPYFPWEFEVKVEYISTFVALAFFNYYVHNFLKIENHSLFLKGILAIHILLAIFVLLTPTKIYSLILPYYSMIIIFVFLTLIYVSTRALFAKKAGSLWHFIGIFVFFLTIVNDIFYYLNILHTTDLAPFGLFFYLFVQAILLAARISESFNREEEMTNKLNEINVNLENIVHERTEELVIMNSELQKSLNARKELISSVSHEMRSPLTTIKSYTKGVIDGVFKTSTKAPLQLVYDETIFIERMIDDLFELSLLELRQYTFYYEKTEPVAFFYKLFKKYDFEVTQAELEFQFHVNNQMDVEINIDPIRIEQVFVNLLRNALRHTTKGSITIELTCSLKYISLSIKDTGTGIDEGELPMVFTKFFKGNYLTSKKNSGIGLTVCKEIIETHGGTISVKSRKGEGSTFTFDLMTVHHSKSSAN